MSNKEWDKKSYNESYYASLEKAKEGYENLKEISEKMSDYDHNTKTDNHFEIKDKGSDVY